MTYKSITYKKTDIRFYDKGKGNALVFLHGFLENLNMWDPYFEQFSKRHRLIAIDLIGHGKSGCTGYIHSMEDMADCVHAVLHELKIRKATLIGHSMGGYVALAFAELYAEQVRGIALVASTTRADSADRKVNRDRAIQLIKKSSHTFVSIAIANLFSEQARTTWGAEIEKAKTAALKTPVQGIIAALEGMKSRPDREVLLHFGPYPITFILGEDDTVMPIAELESEIIGSNATKTILSGGHMLHIENTLKLGEALHKFIKTNRL